MFSTISKTFLSLYILVFSSRFGTVPWQCWGWVFSSKQSTSVPASTVQLPIPAFVTLGVSWHYSDEMGCELLCSHRFKEGQRALQN